MHCTDCGAPIDISELTSRKIYKDAKLYEHMFRSRGNYDDLASSQTETDNLLTSGASAERRIFVKHRHCEKCCFQEKGACAAQNPKYVTKSFVK